MCIDDGSDLCIDHGSGVPTPSGSAPTAPSPTPAQGPCAKLWGQCGGLHHTGHKCCESGSHCEVSNPYYSQCLPGAPPSAPTPRPTTRMDTPKPTPLPDDISTEPTHEPAPEPEPEPTAEPQPEPEPEPEIQPVNCDNLHLHRNLTYAGEQCNSYSDQLRCSQGFISYVHSIIPCVWTGCGCFADGANLLDCTPFATPAPTTSQTCAALTTSKWTDADCEKKCNKESKCNKKCHKQFSSDCKCNTDRRLKSIVLV